MVRDRGVGLSNPLAPTNFSKKTLEIKSARPLGSNRVVSVSNQASRSSEPQKYSGFAVVAAVSEGKWLPCGYPITPSSSMAEAADAWAEGKVPNLRAAFLPDRALAADVQHQIARRIARNEDTDKH